MMNKLTTDDIASVKGRGFLRNRGTDTFSGRITAPGTVFSADALKSIATLSEIYGNGTAICTSRLCIEVPGIPFDKIEAAESFAADNGLHFGGTGSRIRPIAACKGSTCVFGNCNTHSIAKRIHNDFYLGWSNIPLPHKFKITVGGCPNSCMKPALNDFGIEGHRVPAFDSTFCKGCKVCAVFNACPVNAVKIIDKKPFINKTKCISCGVCTGKCPFSAVAHDTKPMYQIYIGGTWGKHTRTGTPLSRLVTENEIFDILERTLLWFKENAYEKERLGLAIDRIGFDSLENAVFSSDLSERKNDILQAAIKRRVL